MRTTIMTTGFLMATVSTVTLTVMFGYGATLFGLLAVIGVCLSLIALENKEGWTE